MSQPGPQVRFDGGMTAACLEGQGPTHSTPYTGWSQGISESASTLDGICGWDDSSLSFHCLEGQGPINSLHYNNWSQRISESVSASGGV